MGKKNDFDGSNFPELAKQLRDAERATRHLNDRDGDKAWRDDAERAWRDVA